MKQTSLKNFQIIEKIGEGSFSVVYRVIRLSDNKEYALKKVKMASLKQKEKENSLNEVRILASINNPHIIQYKEAFIDDNNLCLIMEIAQYGDLLHRIKKYQLQKQQVPEKEIWQTLYQIVLGLNAMHKMKILHRDIKCANIFISKDENNQKIIKLGDLNVSKVAKQGLLRTQIGTPYYASPEVWKDLPYDSKSDIWSIGCIIYEMAALKPPFRATDMDGLYKKVIGGVYDALPKIYSQDLSAIISELLQVNPNLRPSCEQLLQNQLILRHNNQLQVNKQVLQSDLLDTIELPKNLNSLKGKLPYAQYDDDIEIIRSRKNSNIQIENHERIYEINKNNLKPKIMNEIQSAKLLENIVKVPSQNKLNQVNNNINNLPINLLYNKQINIQKQPIQQSISTISKQTNNQVLHTKQPNIFNNYYEKQKQIQRELSPLLRKEQLQNKEKEKIDQMQRHQMYLRDKIMQSKLLSEQNYGEKQQMYLDIKNLEKLNIQKIEISKSQYQRLPQLQSQQQRYSDRITDLEQISQNSKQIVIANSNKVRLAAGQQILNNQVSKPTWWG